MAKNGNFWSKNGQLPPWFMHNECACVHVVVAIAFPCTALHILWFTNLLCQNFPRFHTFFFRWFVHPKEGAITFCCTNQNISEEHGRFARSHNNFEMNQDNFCCKEFRRFSFCYFRRLSMCRRCETTDTIPQFHGKSFLSLCFFLHCL